MTDKELKPRGSTGKYKSRHGMYGTKLYHIWNGIRNRCLNPKNKDYANYGGRGIDICPEWNEPEKFFGWAFLNGYSVDMSLDRIDNNKGYSPDNCRWVLLTEQQRNKRNNHIIEYDGESHCIAEWAEITGINKQTILSRLRYGWTIKDVLSIKPSHQNKSRRYNNGEK